MFDPCACHRSFFTPALLFSKVAFSLNPRRLAELLIVPIGFVLITSVSAFAAWTLSKLARLTKAQRNFAMACAISPNSNSLPVALMQSLVLTVPQLHWEEEGEPEDTVDQMLGRALTYLVLFSTLGMFLRWSVGAKLLSTVEDAGERQQAHQQGSTDAYRDDPDQQHETPRTARLIDYEDEDQASRRGAPTPQIHVRSPTEHEDDGADRPPPEPLTDGGRPPVRRSSNSRSGPPAWTRSFPNSPGSPPDSRGESLLDEEEAQQRQRDIEGRARGPSTWEKSKGAIHRLTLQLLVQPALAVNAFMTAPLWAAVLSLVVALISPLQAFIDSLEPVVGALQTSGACSIPLTMVVLGAYFVEEKSAVDDDLHHQNGQEGYSRPANSQLVRSPAAVAESDDERRPWGTSSEAATINESTGSLSWMKNPWSSAESNADTAGRSDDHRLSAHQLPLLNGSSSRSGSGSATPSKQQQAVLSARQETKTIVVSIASRMVVTPLILIPALAWYAIATRYNVMDDPVMIVSACLIIGSPPALTLAQITSQKASGNPQFERLISRTICEYIFACSMSSAAGLTSVHPTHSCIVCIPGCTHDDFACPCRPPHCRV